MTPVSELLALKIEILSLKLQQLQAQGDALAAEQRTVIEEARQSVGAPVGHLYNMETRLFQSKSSPAPFSAPARRLAKRARR